MRQKATDMDTVERADMERFVKIRHGNGLA
jgi:hypothetical protein